MVIRLLGNSCAEQDWHPVTGWQWACLASRKARASCPTFLGAEACEAKVRTLPLVIIGGGCFTESADILSAFP